MRARSADAAAWAAHPRYGRGARRECPDEDVDGAYRALRATVARGLTYRTGSSDLAEDLTQDVFVDLLLASRCRPPSNTRAWLARVAQRHVADTIGSAVRERTARAQLEASTRGLPDEGSTDPEIRLAIRACMAQLSQPQQRIIGLRLLQGQSFAHCGLRLGMSEDAARMRFRRALHALRVELARAGVVGR
jgi:RNA polymerase sigma factor (sigma-70 family)